MRHVMIDIETLGSTPGCAILSIGAVRFDLETLELGPEFYTAVDLHSCLDYDLKVEGHTFGWWMQQPDAARLALLENPKHICDALNGLTGFLEGSPYVWAHGPSFDLSVLSVAYSQIFTPKPWHYRKERDTRTLLDLAGIEMEKPEGAHHALVDAKHQATRVMEAWRILHVDYL